MRVVALALALVACKSKASDPPAAQPPAPPQPSPVAAPAAPKLPGTLYFKTDHALARLSGGTLSTDFADVDAEVFPSRYALPDGRVVGIASKGDGEPGSEQLVTIAGREIARIGPAATQVRNPAVDPAGKWIVVEAKLSPASQLYRIDVATGDSKPLTTDPQGNFAPAALGPRDVVFASSRDGDSELYRIDLETAKQTRLTAFHRDEWAAAPSPDGKTIAFLSDREGMPRIFLIDADGANLRRLTTRTERDAEEDEPVWSPDGKSLAYTVMVVGKSSIVVVRDVAAGTERVVTPPRAKDAEPAFSPDGKWLAVVRDGDVWAVPLAGGDAVRVTSTPASEHLPRWFP